MIILAIRAKLTSPILHVVLTWWLTWAFWILHCACGPCASVKRGGAIARVVVAAGLPVAAGPRAEVVDAVGLARPLRQPLPGRLLSAGQPQPPHRLFQAGGSVGAAAVSTTPAAVLGRRGVRLHHRAAPRMLPPPRRSGGDRAGPCSPGDRKSVV